MLQSIHFKSLSLNSFNMDKPHELTGYLHAVSPVKKSSKSSYFEMLLQTGSDSTVRAICFATKKHDDLKARSSKKSPVKLSNFQMDLKSNTVLMDNKVRIDATKVSFAPKEIPQTNNIASLSGVHFQQLITIKAKVTKISGTKKVTTANGEKCKAECFLSDPSGTITLTLWEDKINEVSEGKTYTFHNVRVIKEYKSDKLALGTTMHDCTVSEAEDFIESLPLSVELPDSFTTTEAKVEVTGLLTFGKYLSCLQCHKKVADGSFTAKIIKCGNCNLTQKRDKCITNCFAQVKVSQDDNQFTVTFFQEQIKKVFNILQRPQTLDEEKITEALLDAPILKIKYDNKSKIINEVSPYII